MTTQELEQQVKDLTTLVSELQSRLDKLSKNTTIPLEVGEAMKARILQDAGVAAVSTKGATTENQSVNEAGVATYSVLKPPDGFLQITLLSNIYYIPYYS